MKLYTVVYLNGCLFLPTTYNYSKMLTKSVTILIKIFKCFF